MDLFSIGFSFGIKDDDKVTKSIDDIESGLDRLQSSMEKMKKTPAEEGFERLGESIGDVSSKIDAMRDSSLVPMLEQLNDTMKSVADGVNKTNKALEKTAEVSFRLRDAWGRFWEAGWLKRAWKLLTGPFYWGYKLLEGTYGLLSKVFSTLSGVVGIFFGLGKAVFWVLGGVASLAFGIVKLAKTIITTALSIASSVASVIYGAVKGIVSIVYSITSKAISYIWDGIKWLSGAAVSSVSWLASTAIKGLGFIVEKLGRLATVSWRAAQYMWELSKPVREVLKFALTPFLLPLKGLRAIGGVFRRWMGSWTGIVTMIAAGYIAYLKFKDAFAGAGEELAAAKTGAEKAGIVYRRFVIGLENFLQTITFGLYGRLKEFLFKLLPADLLTAFQKLPDLITGIFDKNADTSALSQWLDNILSMVTSWIDSKSGVLGSVGEAMGRLWAVLRLLMFKAIASLSSGLFDAIGKLFDDKKQIDSVIGNFFYAILNALKSLVVGFAKGAWDVIGNALFGGTTVKSVLYKLWVASLDLGSWTAAVLDTLDGVINNVIGFIKGGVDFDLPVSLLIKGIISNIGKVFDVIWGFIKKHAIGIWDKFGEWITGFRPVSLAAVTRWDIFWMMLEKAYDVVSALINDISKSMGNWLSKNKQKLFKISNAIGKFFGEAIGWAVKSIISLAGTFVRSIARAFGIEFGDPATVREGQSGFEFFLTELFSTTFGIAQEAGKGLLDGLLGSLFQTSTAEIGAKIEEKIKGVGEWLKGKGGFVGLFDWLVIEEIPRLAGLAVDEVARILLGKRRGMLEGAVGDITEVFGPVGDVISHIWNTFGEGINNFWNQHGDKIKTILKVIGLESKNLFLDMFATSTEFVLKWGYAIAKTLLEYIVKGIFSALSEIPLLGPTIALGAAKVLAKAADVPKGLPTELSDLIKGWKSSEEEIKAAYDDLDNLTLTPTALGLKKFKEEADAGASSLQLLTNAFKNSYGESIDLSVGLGGLSDEMSRLAKVSKTTLGTAQYQTLAAAASPKALSQVASKIALEAKPAGLEGEAALEFLRKRKAEEMAKLQVPMQIAALESAKAATYELEKLKGMPSGLAPDIQYLIQQASETANITKKNAVEMAKLARDIINLQQSMTRENIYLADITKQKDEFSGNLIRFFAEEGDWREKFKNEIKGVQERSQALATLRENAVKKLESLVLEAKTNGPTITGEEFNRRILESEAKAQATASEAEYAQAMTDAVSVFERFAEDNKKKTEENTKALDRLAEALLMSRDEAKRFAALQPAVARAYGYKPSNSDVRDSGGFRHTE